MEKLVPNLVQSLKKKKQWEIESHSLYVPDKTLELIFCEKDFSEAAPIDDNLFDKLISKHLDDNINNGENNNDDGGDKNDNDGHGDKNNDDDSTSAGQNLECEQTGTVTALHESSHDEPQDNQNQQEDITEALCNLLTDINPEPTEPSTTGVLVNPKRFIKDLQPHREKPSKDRARRFYCGALYGDKVKPDNHDVVLFDFWAIKPCSKTLCQAKYFLIAKIMFMMDLEKPCDSNISSNKNLQIIFEVYSYNPEIMSYVPEGRTGVLKAHKLLIACISTEASFHMENSVIKFRYEEVAALEEYMPYHEDADVVQRVEKLSESADSCSENETADPYIVDKVLNKRFHAHRHQYEFLVSWVGYTDTTWELAENIPSIKISEYEKNSDHTKSRCGRLKKTTVKPDYIKTF